MEKEYRYDAFISYRHNELDKFVAENIHKMLETYKLPDEVVKKYNLESNRIKRVFRDEEELPLSSNLADSIEEALHESKFLIVVCSPRLKDSIWCQKEIETFIKLNGRKNIICVLVEGEPSDSFPEQLLYEEVKENKKIVKKAVEPLAADVRAINQKEVKKKLKDEILRVVAALKNIYYDDLKQRHKERENKRKAKRLKIIISIMVLFTIYSTIMFFIIFAESKAILAQQTEILSRESLTYLEKDNRLKAIETSKEALEIDETISSATYSLTESLGVYDIKNYKAQYQFDTAGIVESIKVNKNNNYLLIYDRSLELSLWNIETKEKINTHKDIKESSSNKFTYYFLNDNEYMYVTDKGINIYNVDKTLVKTIEKKGITSISLSLDNSYVAINTYDEVELYSLKDDKTIYTYKVDKGYNLLKEIYFNNNYLIFFDVRGLLLDSNNNSISLNIYNLNNGNVKKLNLDTRYIGDVVFKDNKMFIASNKGTINDIVSNIYSINLDSASVEWKNSLQDTWSSSIQRGYADSSESILVGTSSSIYIFNYKDGKKMNSLAIGEATAKIFASTTSDLFLVFTKSGDVKYVNPKTGDAITYIGLYDMNLEYTSFQVSNFGYLGVPVNENRVVLYNIYDNKEKEEIEYSEKELETISYQEMNEIKEQYNLPKKNLVKSMVYSSDKKELFVSYSDDTLEIYNDKKELINMVTDMKDDIKYYIGKDKNNNIYVSGISYGYILNKNYEKIAKVYGLLELDKNNNKVIVKISSKYYKLPIYSIKELKNIKY